MCSAPHSPRSREDTFNVFLVEDSPIIRERIVDLIEPMDGTRLVGFAERSEEAIRDIVAQRPDAVLLDLSLREGSGIDVLRALKDEAPDVDVFVLTNSTSAQYRRLCDKLGARGFFDKSTEFDKVREVIASRARRLH